MSDGNPRRLLRITGQPLLVGRADLACRLCRVRRRQRAGGNRRRAEAKTNKKDEKKRQNNVHTSSSSSTTHLHTIPPKERHHERYAGNPQSRDLHHHRTLPRAAAAVSRFSAARRRPTTPSTMQRNSLLAPVIIPGTEPWPAGTTEEEKQEMRNMVKYQKWGGQLMESCPVKVLMAGTMGEWGILYGGECWVEISLSLALPFAFTQHADSRLRTGWFRRNDVGNVCIRGPAIPRVVQVDGDSRAGKVHLQGAGTQHVVERKGVCKGRSLVFGNRVLHRGGECGHKVVKRMLLSIVPLSNPLPPADPSTARRTTSGTACGVEQRQEPFSRATLVPWGLCSVQQALLRSPGPSSCSCAEHPQSRTRRAGIEWTMPMGTGIQHLAPRLGYQEHHRATANVVHATIHLFAVPPGSVTHHDANGSGR